MPKPAKDMGRKTKTSKQPSLMHSHESPNRNMSQLQGTVVRGGLQNSAHPEGDAISRGIHACYPISAKGFILMYALHIGKLRPKKGKMLSQGHPGARAGQAKFIPRDGHLQAPALSQLGLGM